MRAEKRALIKSMMNIVIKRYGFESKTTIRFCIMAEHGDFLKTYKLFMDLME